MAARGGAALRPAGLPEGTFGGIARFKYGSRSYRVRRRSGRPAPPNPPKPMKITQAFRFEAAHYLPNVPETHRCKRMHGHSYRVELQLSGPINPVTGFVLDFFEIEAAFGPLLKRLDHYCLNEVEGLENPTAENIAIWIWRRTKPELPQLCGVRVYETSDCWADYAGEDD